MKMGWVSFLVLASWATALRAQVITENFGSGANAFSIDFVRVGNPGNAADTTGSPNPAGAVSYIYNIGKYEISRDLFTKAANAGALGITANTAYSLNHPVIGASWNEAARFVNWLNTSKGYQAAYNFTTSGANDNITLWAAGQYNGNNQFRHKNAVYFLPSIDEWYKAAYYDPTLNSGTGGYWDYATQSNSAPTAVTGGTTAGTAVYGGSVFAPAVVTSAGGLSYYGTMAQNGNAWDRLETAQDGINNDPAESRGIRGGKPGFGSGLAANDYLYGNIPTQESSDVTFRVAMVPEPTAGALLVLGLGGVMALRRVRRKAD